MPQCLHWFHGWHLWVCAEQELTADVPCHRDTPWGRGTTDVTSRTSHLASLPCVTQRSMPPRTCGWAHGHLPASSWPGTTARPRRTATGWSTAPWPGSTTMKSWCHGTPVPPPGPPSQVCVYPHALPPPPPPLRKQWRAQISIDARLPSCWHTFEAVLGFTSYQREGFAWHEAHCPLCGSGFGCCLSTS